MFCHNCGIKIEDNHKFCKQCGEVKRVNGIEVKVTKTKKSKFLDFKNYKLKNIDLDTAKKHVRNGIIAGLVVLVMSILNFLVFNYDPTGWFDVILFILLIFGLYRKGVISAVLLLVFYIASLILNIITGEYSSFWVYLIKLIIVNYFFLGILGCIKFKKLAPPKEKHSRSNLILGIILGVLITFFIAYLFINKTSVVENNGAMDETISASVVNVLCPTFDANGEITDESSGGSGTILTEDGLIITNSHVIPQDEENLHVSELGCLVILPEPGMGTANEMYWADPIVLPGVSETYDIAYLSVTGPYEDSDGVSYGEKSKVFPAFKGSKNCGDENVKLGEKIRILGYPSSSGGSSLTITDGVVSSFPGDDLILTSAKIDSGNSGGLAVDINGCMIGIPSAVMFGEYNNLGVIISMNLVNNFNDEVQTYLDNHKSSN